MADRQVLAVECLSVLAVINVRVMQVDEIFIAVCDDHPMWGFRARQAITADQDQGLASVAQNTCQIQLVATDLLYIAVL